MKLYHGHRDNVRVKIKKNRDRSLHLSLQVRGFIFWKAYDRMKTTFDVELSSEYIEIEPAEGRRKFPMMIPMVLDYQLGSFCEVWPVNKFNLYERCEQMFEYYDQKESDNRVISSHIKKMFS